MGLHYELKKCPHGFAGSFRGLWALQGLAKQFFWDLRRGINRGLHTPWSGEKKWEVFC